MKEETSDTYDINNNTDIFFRVIAIPVGCHTQFDVKQIENLVFAFNFD